MTTTIDPREVEAAIAEAIGHAAVGLRCGSLSPVALLRAICQVETSGGARWAATLHEDAYCYGGHYYKGDGRGGRMGDDALRDLTGAWGCLAHQSFGPWQVLFITAYEAGYRGDPVGLRDPRISAPYVVSILNRRVADRMTGDPKPLPDHFFRAWNTGSPDYRGQGQEYVEKAVKAYRAFMGDLDA